VITAKGTAHHELHDRLLDNSLTNQNMVSQV